MWGSRSGLDAESKGIAAKIRLNFLTFQAKMNKACVFYEQESGDLDEDELYQVHLNPHNFYRGVACPFGFAGSGDYARFIGIDDR